MALRPTTYAALTFERIAAAAGFRPGDPLPEFVYLVLYHGDGPWRPATGRRHGAGAGPGPQPLAGGHGGAGAGPATEGRGVGGRKAQREGLPGSDAIDRVTDALFECGTGEEFIERVRAV